MPTPLNLCRRSFAPALIAAATITSGLLVAPPASAMPNVSAAERHAQRVEERLARQTEHRTEAEARRTAREEARAARQLARQERLGARKDGKGTGSEAGTPNDEASQGHAGECQVELSAGSPQVLVGESVVLSGSVTCPGALAATAPHVDIYERAGSARSGLALVQSLASSEGKFTTTSGPLTADTVFKAVLGAKHARVTVKVAPTVTLSAEAASATATAGSVGAARTPRTKITFSGSAAPALQGALVALQVSYAATGEHWRSVAWTHTSANGAYTLDHVLRTPGVTSVRTILHAGAHLGLGVSETLSLQGSQPEHPALTIAASADPLVAGQAVKISGVAAGGSHVPVRLLARTREGSFAMVAEGTTDENGNYSFEQTPSETTLYRVTDATESSTTLKEDVAFTLTPTVVTTASAGETVAFTGTLAPAAAGQPVVLEARSRKGIGFQPIATGAVDSASTYSISHSFPAAGEYVLRVRAPGDGAHSAATSAPFVVAVTP